MRIDAPLIGIVVPAPKELLPYYRVGGLAPSMERKKWAWMDCETSWMVARNGLAVTEVEKESAANWAKI